jgi:hypothetical protein
VTGEKGLRKVVAGRGVKNRAGKKKKKRTKK